MTGPSDEGESSVKTATSKSRFRPGVDPLETRALLSTLTASLKHGVVTVRRDDASLPIQVDVQTLSAQRRGGSKGAVLVHGIARFDLKKVKAITIDAGPSDANVTVHVPTGLRLPVRIIAPAAPAPDPAPSSAPAVPGVTGVLSAFEGQIFAAVNAERTKAGLPALAVNAKLVTAAQIHAGNMAALDVMQHELPGVALPTLVSRAQYVGYRYGWLAENIASYYSDASALVAGWMASPEHRANILNANLTEAGVGVGRDARGNLFICQEFASPAPG